MTITDREALIRQLQRHEGLRLRMYTDTTGHRTIGYGHNLDATPITERAARVMLEDDLDACVRDLVAAFPWFVGLDAVRQRALVDLRFNMGLPTLKTFRRTLAAFAQGDFDTAATHLVASKWYRQVGVRGPRVVAMVRTGEAP